MRDDRLLEHADAVDLAAHVLGELALLLGAEGGDGRLERREDEEDVIALRVAVEVEAQAVDEEARQVDHLGRPARHDDRRAREQGQQALVEGVAVIDGGVGEREKDHVADLVAALANRSSAPEASVTSLSPPPLR